MEEEDFDGEPVPTKGPSIDDALESLKKQHQETEERDHVYQSAFSRRDRLVVEARDAGATLKQIADVLGFSTGTVQEMVNRAGRTNG